MAADGPRTNYRSDAPWEVAAGFSRAVRIGQAVHVSGTAATGPDGRLVGVGDAYAQARQALANVEAALARAGAGLKDVVRTRIYVTDIDRWAEIGRAHAEALGGAAPAGTMVQVARLIDPEMLVAIEADAVAPDDWIDDALR
ncbi:MAG: Rid family hydrolase [Rhodospirillales bacterium]